jgi:hypothetical protein
MVFKPNKAHAARSMVNAVLDNGLSPDWEEKIDDRLSAKMV